MCLRRFHHLCAYGMGRRSSPVRCRQAALAASTHGYLRFRRTLCRDTPNFLPRLQGLVNIMTVSCPKPSEGSL